MKKTVIITGGTSLIAEETVKLLKDWNVYPCSRTHDNYIDVTDPQSVEAMIDIVLCKESSIDAVVNLAGGFQIKTNFLDTHPEKFKQVMDLNFYGAVNMTRAALPHLMVNGGSIVNIVSRAAMTGFPKCASYSAAKAALLVFTRTIAQEYAEHNVRANCILPGFTASKRNDGIPQNALPKSPLNRHTTPIDVANMIKFLLSNEADHITGACMDLSGGVALH